jgi:hypothetical protein
LAIIKAASKAKPQAANADSAGEPGTLGCQEKVIYEEQYSDQGKTNNVNIGFLECVIALRMRK